MIKELSIRFRLKFIVQKYIALVVMSAGRVFPISMPLGSIGVSTINDLAMLQTCLLDVKKDLVDTGALGTSSQIVDIGANIGCWTAAVKSFLPDASVIAIEPDPLTFQSLMKNVGGIPGVSLINCAVGSLATTMPLFRQPGSDRSTLVPSPTDSTTDRVEVQLRTLDEITDGLVIDLVKIDVEGFEGEVIRGAEDLLRRARYLLMEVTLNGRDANAISTIAEVFRIVPRARIVKFGRIHGEVAYPSCIDVLFSLN